jgi:hypothetical protein
MSFKLLKNYNHHKFVTIISHFQAGYIDLKKKKETIIMKVDLWIPLLFKAEVINSSGTDFKQHLLT